MKVTVLGSGTSTGVPQIGCTCEVCRSTDRRDNRLRCSGLVEVDGVRILIDCGPDFRQQCLLYLSEFAPIDAVLITHEHYDHVGGLDDLRPFCAFRDVPVYAEEHVAECLQHRMPYCFARHPYPGVPNIPVTVIDPFHPFVVDNASGKKVEVVPFRVEHGSLPILGYRIGPMAWITDMLTLPEESYSYLREVDNLFMNALRIAPHHSHQSLSEALEQAGRIRAKHTWLIHMSHQIGLHAEVERMLPCGVHLAYDGLQVEE